MTGSVRTHAQDLADYLNDTVLDYDEVSYADILEALASLGTTLVEDPVADSTLTYYELLPQPEQESGSGADRAKDFVRSRRPSPRPLDTGTSTRWLRPSSDAKRSREN